MRFTEVSELSDLVSIQTIGGPNEKSLQDADCHLYEERHGIWEPVERSWVLLPWTKKRVKKLKNSSSFHLQLDSDKDARTADGYTISGTIGLSYELLNPGLLANRSANIGDRILAAVTNALHRAAGKLPAKKLRESRDAVQAEINRQLQTLVGQLGVKLVATSVELTSSREKEIEQGNIELIRARAEVARSVQLLQVVDAKRALDVKYELEIGQARNALDRARLKGLLESVSEAIGSNDAYLVVAGALGVFSDSSAAASQALALLTESRGKVLIEAERVNLEARRIDLLADYVQAQGGVGQGRLRPPGEGTTAALPLEKPSDPIEQALHDHFAGRVTVKIEPGDGVRKKYTVRLPDFGICISFRHDGKLTSSIKYGSLDVTEPEIKWSRDASGSVVEVVERICREKGKKPK